MKKTAILLLIMLLSVCVFSAEWENSLKPKGKTKTIEIAKSGKALYTIIIPENAGVNESLASEDLSQTLNKIYNTEFKVVSDNETVKGKFISLGDTAQLKKSSLKIPNLNIDGYAIMEKNGNIYITGGIRSGSLSGVYALLEEDLGCRWYTLRQDERIPKAKNGKLSFVPRSYNPQFLLRHVSLPEFYEVTGWDIWNTYTNKKRPFNRRNRMNMFEPNGGAHTVFTYVPVSNFEEHPDWFSMKGGERKPQQLCFSSEGMYETLLANMRKEMKSYPKDRFMIDPMDSISLCECPECKALSDAEGTNMAPYMKCMNRIAGELKKDYPNLVIQLLAYLDYVKAPKTIKPADNMEIMVCSDCCDWNFPLCTLKESEKFSAIMDDWTQTGDTITWNYVSNYDHLLMPNPNLTVIAEDIRQMKDWGVKGSYLQGIGWENKNLQASGRMKVWVWGKLLWDPSLDTEALLKDFCLGYYGEEIGSLVLEYENSLIDMYEKAHAIPHNPNEETKLLIEAGLPVFNSPARENKGVVFEKGIRWSPDVEMYTDEWVDKSMALMDKALSLAKTDEEKEKVLYLRTNVIYLKLARKLGYFTLGSGYVGKPRPDEAELRELRPLFEELNSTLTGYGTYCIAEITDQNHTKEKLMTKWNQILTV
ncbi:MAG: DUF4838 domain-containing protein, partial [Armatimonadetes bacterium]|nr:DUF4838 domain-containing protein [Candidatus Hippobium faecium]